MTFMNPLNYFHFEQNRCIIVRKLTRAWLFHIFLVWWKRLQILGEGEYFQHQGWRDDSILR